MADARERHAHALFKQLLELDAGERDATLARMCADDDKMQARVRQLLNALSNTHDFLESPVGAAVRNAAIASNRSTAHPTIQGFHIERLLGAGGMAAVYEATQEWPRRRVALKVMRRSMVGTAALRRFEFETEVLAKLRHPGIAQMYEAGTFDDGAGGAPFFAMEYIEGAPTLIAYCEGEKLDLRARLEMMIRVCDAVQHGHQNGVIHRDLKPGNVLVDAAGNPRVIDFGIARSTSEAGTLASNATTAGQIIGTLNAMSPEQCRANGEVDARTDVYSLGVLLYELTCHRLPHDVSRLPVPEALRVIHEVAPLRPSAIDPRLRGDIEVIVLKAIEKDPDRRYRTVAALGADLRRFLEHQTIEARPPTIFYQVRLFARRNRVVVTAVAVVALSLVVATAVSVWSAARASSERDVAVRKTYVASMAASLSSFQFGEFGQMRRRLDDAPVAHRGWEWRWLDAFADRSILCVHAHDDMVTAMATSPDGLRIATGARDGSVRTWMSADVARVAACRPHAEQVNDIGFFPDGERIITASHDGTLAVIRARDGVVESTLRESAGQVGRVAARDNATVASATRNGVARIWNVTTGEAIHTFSDQPDEILGVRYSADGAWLITWGSNGSAWIRDGTTNEPRHKLSFDGDITTVNVRGDLGWVAVGGVEGRMVVWNLKTGAEMYRFTLGDRVSSVRAIAFNRDGTLFAAGQGNSNVGVLETATGRVHLVAAGHEDAISGLAFSVDGQRVVSSSWDETVRLWDVEERQHKLIRSLAGHQGRAMTVDFEPNGPRIASGGVDRTVRLWDTDIDKELAALQGHEDIVYDVEFSPDGRLLASASFDDTVRLWDATTGAERGAPLLHTSDVWAVDFSPDSSMLASASDDGTIRIWNVETHTCVRTLTGHAVRVTNVQFSHDGTRIASTSRDGSVRVWSVATGATIRELRGHESDTFAVAWSLDDARLYTGSRDRTVRVWSPATGVQIDCLRGTDEFVTSIAIAPDGSRLFASTWFGSLAIFDPDARDLVASFKAVSGVVRGLAVSSDGRRLALAGGDGAIRILDSASSREQSALREGAADC